MKTRLQREVIWHTPRAPMRRFIASALLIAQAAAALHLATALHTLSPVTGNFVEAQQDSCRPVEAQDRPIFDSGCGHDGLHDDEQCDSLVFSRALATPHTSVISLAVLATVSPCATAETVTRAPLDVLRVAPKSSPPV
jgi:hypothetical protein